jgi:ribosome-binding protein aMBF1 (putative translation factor)
VPIQKAAGKAVRKAGVPGERKGKGKRAGSGSVYTREYRVFLTLLVAARERSELSQRALAEKLGRSYSYIAKCETGYARMDIFQIRQYLDAVEMPFLEFMQAYEQAYEAAAGSAASID